MRESNGSGRTDLFARGNTACEDGVESWDDVLVDCSELTKPGDARDANDIVLALHHGNEERLGALSP